MKIAITGSAGFLGKNLFRDLSERHEVYGISRRQSPTTTHRQDIIEESVREVLSSINPDVIVHAAALTWVDYCEKNREEAERANVLGTNNLVNWVEDYGRKIVFISTDAVYPGETNDYNERSETRPVNFYGETKFQGERLVSMLEGFLILRTTFIFGYEENGKNFLMQLLNEKGEKKIPYDQVSNPTDVAVLCDYVRGCVERDALGLFVATGPEIMDRREFTKKAVDIFGLDERKFQYVSTAELGQVAKRPLNNGTDSSEIRKLLDYQAPGVEESLRRIKESL